MTRTMRRRLGRPSAAGFTLLEMLTVVIIVGLLLAIGTPSVLHLQLIAMRKASLVTVRLIAGGCDAYKNDHEQYPPSMLNSIEGKHNVVRALVGYGPVGDDGANGLGFRLPSGSSKIWGPYRGCERAKMKTVGGRPVFVDAFDYPIFYYRGKWGTDNGVRTFNGFDMDDNTDGPDSLNGQYARTRNGTGSYFRKDFLLCSKGPDGSWPNEVTANYETPQAAFDQRDDITNIMQED